MPDIPEVHLVAGTRPEAIKLAPVAAHMRRRGRLRPVFVASGQHPTMVGQALDAFGATPDIALPLTRHTGSQPELFAALTERLDALLGEHRPAAVVVQGDTTTTFAAALAAFWRRVPIVHLEAGLRSGDLAAPFPEEANRRLVAQLADLHLAPTAAAAANLLDEGVPADRVLLCGNTVVDAALEVLARQRGIPPFADPQLLEAVRGGRLVLVTAHRRESWGAPLDRVIGAVRRLLETYPDLRVVLPSHPNPAVRAQVAAGLARIPRAVVTDPLPYEQLVAILSRAYLVLTDSGGIQEEAPTFGVPALVLRDVTERVESLRAGCARLVGTDPALIFKESCRLLNDPAARAAMAATGNPYGDGQAAARTEQAVAALLGLAEPPDPMPVADRSPNPDDIHRRF